MKEKRKGIRKEMSYARDKFGRFLKRYSSLKKGKKLDYKVWNKGLRGKKFLKHYKGMKIWNKGRHIKESTRIKISNSKKEFVKNHPEVMKQLAKKHSLFYRKHPDLEQKRRRKISRTMKKFIKRHPEFLKKTLLTLPKFLKKHPEANRKRIEKIKAFWEKNPEYARLVDSRVTRWWREHPNIKEERSEELRQFFINNPDEFKKKFMNGKNNPFSCHIRTKQGFKVRSLGEKRIADFLFEHKIRGRYESEMLILDGYVCVPDFYLSDYDVYVEFYGGFPGSRQKKVLKNRLYGKYSVSCIFVTPSELGDLDNEIIGYLRREFGEGAV